MASKRGSGKKLLKHISAKARRKMVFKGSSRVSKTKSGLSKEHLTKSKSGKIVTKKQQASGKKAFHHISAWSKAVSQARKELGVKGFSPVGGSSARGKALHAKAKSLYHGKGSSKRSSSRRKSGSRSR